MESLLQVQKLVLEHAYMICIGLLIFSVVAGIAWYSMSRGPAKSPVLENQARVNAAEMDLPPSATGPDPNQEEEEHVSQSEE